ncbi:MAG: FimV/HubP family polar landmark protein [Pseudomonadota bacterium]
MNNRIVTWAAVACLSAYASSVGAVALGEMRALSALGEPLKLRLALTDLAAINPADVRVVLAPADDYTRLGLIPPLGAEQWQVAMQNDNGLSALITGTTAQQDPNVSFLVQLIWPGNISVQQVTTVLLPALPVADLAMAEPVLPVVVPEIEPVSPGAVSLSLPSAAVSTLGTAATLPVAIEQIPAAPATARVRAGDTLSQLAMVWALPQASLQQRQQVLAESNPQLFVDGNIDQLKRGAIIRYPLPSGLTLPDAAQAAAWLAARQSAVVPAENEAGLDQPALSSAPESVSPEINEEVTLTLVSPDAAKAGAQSVAEEEAAADQLGELSAKKSALLAERAALQAELAALEKSGSNQDARLKVLDARLAQLNARPAEVNIESGIRPSWVAAAVGFFLALLLIMRRRAAAASAAASATRTAPVLAPESDYVAFEALETLPTPPWTKSSAMIADEAALASAEEEYDFLTDAESAALQTRLDLAQAYIDMQEIALAKELLHTVIERGSAEQRTQASTILDNLA